MLLGESLPVHSFCFWGGLTANQKAPVPVCVFLPANAGATTIYLNRRPRSTFLSVGLLVAAILSLLLPSHNRCLTSRSSTPLPCVVPACLSFHPPTCPFSAADESSTYKWSLSTSISFTHPHLAGGICHFPHFCIIFPQFSANFTHQLWESF